MYFEFIIKNFWMHFEFIIIIKKFHMHTYELLPWFFHNGTKKKVKLFESQEVTVAPEERMKILMHSITEGKIVFSACCYKKN